MGFNGVQCPAIGNSGPIIGIGDGLAGPGQNKVAGFGVFDLGRKLNRSGRMAPTGDIRDVCQLDAAAFGIINSNLLRRQVQADRPIGNLLAVSNPDAAGNGGIVLTAATGMVITHIPVTCLSVGI